MSRAVILSATLVLAACTTVPSPTTTTPRPVVTGPQIIPAPTSLTVRPGAPFDLTRASSIVVDGTNPEVTAIAQTLGDACSDRRRVFHCWSRPTPADTAAANIYLRLSADRTSLGEEGYELTSAAKSLTLVANRPAGLFRGMQTVRQLLPADVESHMGVSRAVWNIPALFITDQPRFAWRGAMLDVARHFFTVKEVQQYIDLLALYKMNVFHIHLSDDQGWRIVINSRPKLHAMGGVTQVGGGPGGYYTQDDYKAIVRYAQERYITVVPEIDMPGHTNAALVAYPEVSLQHASNRASSPAPPSAGARSAWTRKRPTPWWTTSSARSARSRRDRTSISEATRSRLSRTSSTSGSSSGSRRSSIATERRWSGGKRSRRRDSTPNTLAQQWKSDSALAALQYGAKLIMSPAKKVYLDMKYTPTTELGLTWAAIIEVRDAYDWDPASYMIGVTEANIVGVEAPLWSETVRNISAAQYLVMPRLPAVAEIGWTPQAGRSWDSFRVRLASHAPRWNYLGVNYYRSPQIPGRDELQLMTTW